MTKHLDFIRSLPCAVCGNPIQTECAHIRFADARVNKPITGIGTKSGDQWTVPLCNEHHAQQHGSGERKWWEDMERDPVFLAMALHRVSGDHEAGCKIVEANRSK